ncbi:hypothetical protein THAOC_00549 [Thalassiosira oceanica]|uniref:Uncharacterized protein n=1 Tax=Thalassiosira oceanica TaxID=159749 RepID=K0TRD5_THAOC|nr:hypothetical protein THAOC_00549 [Thalassiosira oceanica]|eukprot:EJK77607.1 hypothetical protein THAOC_00549 [Thalassiosira oceanica]
MCEHGSVDTTLSDSDFDLLPFAQRTQKSAEKKLTQSFLFRLVLNAEASRMEFLQQSAAAVAAFTMLPGQANAAKYGGFGAGSPEVIDPKDALVDEDILKSEPVQKALEAVKGYKQSTVDLKTVLSSDNQADIGAKIRKDFDFSVIRTDLNAINAALDEDTQRGTDRIVRAILQDITELEVSQKQKPGVPRSEKRLGNVIGKLDKLEKSFDDYLAFAN